MTGRPGVDFYYGIASRYSYLASTQMARLDEETACRVRWLPIYSGDLIGRCGDPFDGSVVSGQYDWSYRRYDAECWAAYYDIPYNEPDFDDYDSRQLARTCIAAERAMLAVLEGSCRTPIAGLAQFDEAGGISLRAMVLTPDGRTVHETSRAGPASDAERLGRDAGEELRQRAGPNFFAALADSAVLAKSAAPAKSAASD